MKLSRVSARNIKTNSKVHCAHEHSERNQTRLARVGREISNDQVRKYTRLTGHIQGYLSVAG